MAINRVSVRVIRRSNTARLTARNVIAAAAYNAREELYDKQQHETHNYAHRSADLVRSEVLLPQVAPYRWFDREVLWNEVERRERRVDALLAQSIILTLPRELDPVAGADLARDFFGRAFVSRGMVADMAVHTKAASDGGPQPHSHALLTIRRIVDGVFGPKEWGWMGADAIRGLREQWADLTNRRLAEHGISARIDHRRWFVWRTPAVSETQEQREAAARRVPVRDVARVVGVAAIMAGAMTTQAMRDVARRLGGRERKPAAEPLDTGPPQTQTDRRLGIPGRTVRAAAVGVAAGAWTYGEAVDTLVSDHLLPAVKRYPELEPRFDELERRIGEKLTEVIEDVQKRISGNAAILRERHGQQETVMSDTKVTTQEMRDRARREVRVSALSRSAADSQAQQANRRAQEAAASNELILG